MYKILFLTFVSTIILFAKNPKPYAVLGDVVYDNVDKIEKLKDTNGYWLDKNRISQFVSDVKKTKKMGFYLELSNSAQERKKYLNSLRALVKTYDYYLRSAEANYKNSMRRDDYKQFSQLINSGLIHSDRYKKEILEYYYKHVDEIPKEGVIQKYLDEEAALRALRSGKKRHYKTKKELQEEKIRRIREQDKLEKKMLEERLQRKLSKEKLEIRKRQKEELSY